MRLGTLNVAAGSAVALRASMPCALALCALASVGSLALGCSDSKDEEAAGPPEVSAFALNGNVVNFLFAHVKGAYSLTCETGTQLAKASGEPWVSETPACGGGTYYLDGVRYENQPGIDCPPCSINLCIAFPSEASISVGERFLTGLVPASDAGADAGVDAGADGGTGIDLPAFETRPYLGPYQLIVRYRVDPTCGGDLVESAPVAIELPPSP